MGQMELAKYFYSLDFKELTEIWACTERLFYQASVQLGMLPFCGVNFYILALNLNTVTESKEPVEGIAPLNNEEMDYIKVEKIMKTYILSYDKD